VTDTVANAQSDHPSAALAQDQVDNARLQAAITRLATFGGRDDGGVSRQTLTETDLAARRHLIACAQALGCEVGIDDCANLFFRRAGQTELPPVLTGSHADTQPVGGKLDGAYGVVAGLEIIAALNDARIQTLRPIEVVAWTNEEGSRFGPGAMGSSAFVEPTRLVAYRDAADQDGVRFGDALDAALADTPADITRLTMQRPMHACIELHIEQGPVLEQADVPLGVVEGIQSVRWYRVECQGVMAHAGTTPMERRSDAMASACALANQLYAYASEHAERQAELRLTLGHWQVEPNSVNTIASRVVFSIDVRCTDEHVLARFEEALEHLVACARQTGVSHPTMHREIRWEKFFQRAPTHFPTHLLTLAERGCNRASARAGYGRALWLTSGAFHDAMYMADHCPTAMIFVPSKDGISHNAAEYTAPEALFLGAQALAYTVTALAQQP